MANNNNRFILVGSFGAATLVTVGLATLAYLRPANPPEGAEFVEDPAAEYTGSDGREYSHIDIYNPGLLVQYIPESGKFLFQDDRGLDQTMPYRLEIQPITQDLAKTLLKGDAEGIVLPLELKDVLALAQNGSRVTYHSYGNTIIADVQEGYNTVQFIGPQTLDGTAVLPNLDDVEELGRRYVHRDYLSREDIMAEVAGRAVHFYGPAAQNIAFSPGGVGN